MKIHSFVDGTQEHRSGADVGVFEAELSYRVGLGVSDGGHSTLQLNQNHFHARRGLTGRSIIHRAANGASTHGRRAAEGRQDYRGALKSLSQCAPRCAGFGPRGRFVIESVARSISASISATSVSMAFFMVS